MAQRVDVLLGYGSLPLRMRLERAIMHQIEVYDKTSKNIFNIGDKHTWDGLLRAGNEIQLGIEGVDVSRDMHFWFAYDFGYYATHPELPDPGENNGGHDGWEWAQKLRGLF